MSNRLSSIQTENIWKIRFLSKSRKNSLLSDWKQLLFFNKQKFEKNIPNWTKTVITKNILNHIHFEKKFVRFIPQKSFSALAGPIPLSLLSSIVSSLGDFFLFFFFKFHIVFNILCYKIMQSLIGCRSNLFSSKSNLFSILNDIKMCGNSSEIFSWKLIWSKFDYIYLGSLQRDQKCF